MMDGKNIPPKISQWFMKKILPDDEKTYFTDGIEESFGVKSKKEGYLKALIWYWTDFFFTIPQLIRDYFHWRLIMFKNYTKIVFRIIKRQKIYSLINLSGLTIGLTSCIVILLFLDYELGYDMYHYNADNIYRVLMRQPGNMVSGSSSDLWVVSPAILKPTWENDLPEILEQYIEFEKGL